MSEKLEVLWTVTAKGSEAKVFRSRSTARAYVTQREERGSRLEYRITRATWGPESIKRKVAA